MLNSPSERLAAVLRYLLSERGKRAQLAAVCKVSPQAVSNWARDGRVGKENLEAIAAFAGVDVVALTSPSKHFMFNGDTVVGLKKNEKKSPAKGENKDELDQVLALIREAWVAGDHQTRASIHSGVRLMLEISKKPAPASNFDKQKIVPIKKGRLE